MTITSDLRCKLGCSTYECTTLRNHWDKYSRQISDFQTGNARLQSKFGFLLEYKKLNKNVKTVAFLRV